MKTLIIGLFSLALLASGAAWGFQEPEYPPKVLPNLGTAAMCTTTDAVLVIVVNKLGNVKAWQCDKVGTKKIRKEPGPKSGLTVKSVGSLGTITKHADTTGDPCETWVIGGTSYTFCW